MCTHRFAYFQSCDKYVIVCQSTLNTSIDDLRLTAIIHILVDGTITCVTLPILRLLSSKAQGRKYF